MDKLVDDISKITKRLERTHGNVKDKSKVNPPLAALEPEVRDILITLSDAIVALVSVSAENVELAKLMVNNSKIIEHLLLVHPLLVRLLLLVRSPLVCLLCVRILVFDRLVRLLLPRLSKVLKAVCRVATVCCLERGHSTDCCVAAAVLYADGRG